MRKLIRYTMTLSTILLVVACNLNMVYSHYEHVPTKGWERNDTISYDVSPLEISGNYQEKVGLRITGEYPFMGLTLIVDQTAVKSGKSYRDTLNCKLIDHNGNVKGQGVSHYQYEFKLATIPLEAEDSLHITIRHDMKREMLPGITDIGVTLIRQ